MSAYQGSKICVPVFLLVAIQLVALAQAKDDFCYPFAGAKVIELAWAIGSETYHLATPGEVYVVTKSSRFDGHCWVKTEIGWLKSHKVEPTLPPTRTPFPTAMPTPTMTPTPVPACFSEHRAYVAGHMNIRASHTINSALVGAAKRGDVFEVSASRRGNTYCWLNIGVGWMAQTSIVHGSMPFSLLPRIKGSNLFRKQIQGGLNYLWDESLDWFWYVVDNVRSIGPSPRGEDRSIADVYNKHVMIYEGHMQPMIERASVLVHEACHMVQFDRGDRIRPFDSDGRIRLEKECLRVQRRMVWDIDRQHWYADILTEMLSWSKAEWLMSLW